MDFDLTKYTLPTGRSCPFCGEPLLASREGFGNFAAVCLNPKCPKAYRSDDGSRHAFYYEMKPNVSTPSIMRESSLLDDARRQDALGYYAKYSLFSDDHMMKKDFNNFQRETPVQSSAYKLALVISKLVSGQEPRHGFFFGQAGTGKTHLANGILRSAMKQANYNYKAFFLDWREYINLNKQSFNDHTAAARLTNIQAQLSRADLLVLDDFGSERDSDFANDLADTIANKRANRHLVITSNINGATIRQRYGERLFSRFMSHSNGLAFQFMGMQDYRQSM